MERVIIPVVSESSESTLTARVDFKFVGVSLVWLMTLSHCVVFAVTRVMLLVKNIKKSLHLNLCSME